MRGLELFGGLFKQLITERDFEKVPKDTAVERNENGVIQVPQNVCRTRCSGRGGVA